MSEFDKIKDNVQTLIELCEHMASITFAPQSLIELSKEGTYILCTINQQAGISAETMQNITVWKIKVMKHKNLFNIIYLSLNVSLLISLVILISLKNLNSFETHVSNALLVLVSIILTLGISTQRRILGRFPAAK